MKQPRKHGYSREFPTSGPTDRYLLDHIPAELWNDVRAKADRKGISLRTLILTLLRTWAARP